MAANRLFPAVGVAADGRYEPAPNTLSAAAVAKPSLQILALVPDARTCSSSLQIARAAAAIDPEAHITALHVQVDPERLATSDEELALQRLRAVREGDCRQRREETFRSYNGWLDSVGGKQDWIAWRERVGAEEAIVDEESAAADLVTIASPQTLDGHDALHAALFVHRHLVLHTPPLPPDVAPIVGRVMLIAWKPTESARNAIFRTRSWLKEADAVHLVAVERNDLDGALSILGDLGVDAEIHRISRTSGSVGDAVVAYAHDIGADCLVMGAYRHGAFIESVLGGVTNDVLVRGDLPAFLVH